MEIGTFSTIQALAVLLAAVIIYYSRALYQKGNFSRKDSWTWYGFSIILVLAAVLPTYLDILSGIFTRRSLDTLLIFGLLLSFGLIFQLYVRLQQTNKDVTELVRRVAIALGTKKKK